MLAVLLSFLSLFSSPDKSHEDHSSFTVLADSIKRPRHRVPVDSTGRFVEINRIFIIGNKITRDHIILRELTLKTGDIIYTLDLPGVLDLDKKKLINTRLFNTVDIRTLELDSSKIDLLIDLNERWYTFPSPVFELSDRNFNEWWQTYNHDLNRVNYGLRLDQFNMRGRNETLRLHAQFGYTRRFDIMYRFPYIDRRQRHGLIVAFGFQETKNLAYQTLDHKLDYLEDDNILQTVRNVSLTYTYRPSFYESHAFRAEYTDTRIADTIAFLKPDYLQRSELQQKYPSLTYQFVSDHRDYVGYPLRGYYFTGFVTKDGFSKTVDLNKFSASFTYAGFLDLKKGFYLSNNLIGYASVPDDVPYHNYGALGYQKQFVRGYEIYVIEGPAYLLNKVTFKKRIFARTYHWQDMPIPQFRHIPFAIYLKTYGDIGYVSNYPGYAMGSRLTDKLLYGTGGGIDIVGSYDVVIRLEYSFNAEGDSGFFFHIKKEF